MEYQEFKKELADQLKKNLAEGGYQVSVRIADGAEVLEIQKPDQVYVSRFTMGNLYQVHLKSEKGITEMTEMLKDTIKESEGIRNVAEKFRTINVTDYESIKNKIQLSLVRSEQNGGFLSEGIYEKQAFGALVPFIRIPVGEGMIQTRVTPDMLEGYGVSQKELMAKAMENTRSSRPPLLLEAEAGEMGFPCYVVTDREGLSGATTIMYPGTLEELHQRIGTDYYVVPLNVHEVLAIGRSEQINAEVLRKALVEKNKSHKPEERLGSKIYEYCGAEKKLSVCRVEKDKKMER